MIRTPREGERKEKFNPMVRIDTVNGGDPDGSAATGLRQAHPAVPARATQAGNDPNQMAGRIIDLVAPIGKVSAH